MEEILEFIKDKSIDLSDMGVANFALIKNDALKFIDMLKKNNIYVYGGDFVEIKNGKLNYTYTNWSVDGGNISYDLEYSKKFIKKYAKDETYIEFVTKIDLYKLAYQRE